MRVTTLLVVPFADGIGDFVMTLPLLAAIERRWPAVKITVAASSRSELLLDEAQAGRVAVRAPRWLEPDGAGTRGGRLRQLVPSRLTALVVGAAVPLELGRFDRVLNCVRWWESGIDFGRYWTPEFPARPGAVHTVDLLIDRLAAELGEPISSAERVPRLRLRAGARAWAECWRSPAANPGAGNATTGKLVALIPAAHMGIKRWPVERWAGLADALSADGAQPLLFLPPRPDPAERIAAIATRPLPIVREPLHHVAALLGRCSLAIGVDTGLLHVAAAVGTRWVGLFGPTNPELTGPYDRSLGTALVAPFPKVRSCRRCWRGFKYVDDRCRTLRAGSCTTALALPTVLAAARAELARA